MEGALSQRSIEGHRQLRYSVFWGELGLHLLVWSVLAGAAGLSGGLVAALALPVAVLLAAVAEWLFGGTVVRWAAALRVRAVDGGRPRLTGTLLRQLGRFASLVGADSLMVTATSRSYDDLQARRTGTCVVGRPTSHRALAAAAVEAVVAGVAFVVWRGRDIDVDPWALVTLVAVPLATWSVLWALVAAASLHGEPGGAGDLVSRVHPGGETPILGEPGAGGIGLPGAALGVQAFDSRPVPRVEVDGTEVEVLDGSHRYVTRKRRRTAQVEGPEG